MKLSFDWLKGLWSGKPYPKVDELGILLIDMQPKFCSELSDIVKRTVIPAQQKVIRFARTYDVPLYVIEYGEEPTIISLEREIVRSGVTTKKISKEKSDAFLMPRPESPNLHYLLSQNGRTALLLMGAFASGCVYATAESALRNGYQVATAQDLIADPGTKEVKPAEGTIQFFRTNGIYEESSNELIARLQKK